MLAEGATGEMGPSSLHRQIISSNGNDWIGYKRHIHCGKSPLCASLTGNHLQGHCLCKKKNSLIYVNFPHYISISLTASVVACAHRVELAVLRGGQAASAESCTHPAKRDHWFPPPIAERQRLPNVRIQAGVTVRKRPIWVKFDDF